VLAYCLSLLIGVAILAAIVWATQRSWRFWWLHGDLPALLWPILLLPLMVAVLATHPWPRR